jgi:methionine synthase II (cobalamin-independent)
VAHAAVDHVLDVRRRVPGADVVLWLDEPAVNAVLRGSIPTQSGRGTYRSVDEPVVEGALTAIVEALHAIAAKVVLHCCDTRPPYELLRRTGVDALSVDLLVHDRADDDRIGELLDAGVSLVAGIVASTDSALSGDRATVAPVRDLSHRLGIPVHDLAASLLVSPTCGLAGASPTYARAGVAKVRTAARILREEDDDRGEG